jgi:hypothetical protein
MSEYRADWAAFGSGVDAPFRPGNEW